MHLSPCTKIDFHSKVIKGEYRHHGNHNNHQNPKMTSQSQKDKKRIFELFGLHTWNLISECSYTLGIPYLAPLPSLKAFGLHLHNFGVSLDPKISRIELYMNFQSSICYTTSWGGYWDIIHTPEVIRLQKSLVGWKKFKNVFLMF